MGIEAEGCVPIDVEFELRIGTYCNVQNLASHTTSISVKYKNICIDLSSLSVLAWDLGITLGLRQKYTLDGTPVYHYKFRAIDNRDLIEVR